MSLSFKIVKRGDRFAQVERRAKQEAAEIASRAAQTTASVARQLAPVLTGNLRDSIYVEQKGESRFTVGAEADYATYVEHGTAYQEPQPFLRPAFEMARRDFEAALKNFFKKVSE